MGGELLDLGVQVGVRDGQRRVAGQELHRLQVDRSERVRAVASEDGDRADHHPVALERDPGAKQRVRLCDFRVGGRVSVRTEVVVDHDRPVTDRPPGEALAELDLAIQHGGVDLGRGAQQVAAGLALQHGER